MILSLEDGPVVGLESTWQLLTALHDTILQRCNPTPEWVSGHGPTGHHRRKQICLAATGLRGP